MPRMDSAMATLFGLAAPLGSQRVVRATVFIRDCDSNFSIIGLMFERPMKRPATLSTLLLRTTLAASL